MFRTRTLVALLLLAAAGLLAALGREHQREARLGRGPDRAGGKVERCVTCHVRPEEDPGGVHARAAVGCSSCHLGNELAFDKKRAHTDMEPEPGALGTVARTCGRTGCHVREARRFASSLMAHTSGNGSSCSSCHVARKLPGAVPRPHPAVDARVTDDRCLLCHSRSGRIVVTGRPACRAETEVHTRAGLACVDCHLHTDVMGDGRGWEQEEGRVEITCEACHGPVRPGGETTWSEVKDPISRDLLRQHGETRSPDERVRLGRRGTPVWNLRPSGSGWVTLRKGQGVALSTRQTPIDPNHRLRGHERLACSSCHAAWPPAWSTCHPGFD